MYPQSISNNSIPARRRRGSESQVYVKVKPPLHRDASARQAKFPGGECSGTLERESGPFSPAESATKTPGGPTGPHRQKQPVGSLVRGEDELVPARATGGSYGPEGHNNAAHFRSGSERPKNPAGVPQGTRSKQDYRTARIANEGGGALWGSSNSPGLQQAASSIE
jgi:hypothetical protein